MHESLGYILFTRANQLLLSISSYANKKFKSKIRILKIFSFYVLNERQKKIRWAEHKTIVIRQGGLKLHQLHATVPCQRLFWFVWANHQPPCRATMDVATTSTALWHYKYQRATTTNSSVTARNSKWTDWWVTHCCFCLFSVILYLFLCYISIYILNFEKSDFWCGYKTAFKKLYECRKWQLMFMHHENWYFIEFSQSKMIYITNTVIIKDFV